MFKKLLSAILILSMAFTLCSCGGGKSEGAKKYGYDSSDLQNMVTFITESGEKYGIRTEEKTDALIEELGDTFESYNANQTKITDFYADMSKDSDEFFDALKAVSSDYYICVSKEHISDYSVAMNNIYTAWTNTMDSYSDKWNASMKKMYDKCYGLIELGYNKIEYKEYSELFSRFYNEYSGAWGDMYDKSTDAFSVLYNTYSEVFGKFYSGETDIESVLATAASGKAEESENRPDKENIDFSPLKSLEDKINNETENSVSALSEKYSALKAEIPTYSEYIEKIAEIESFYGETENVSKQISDSLKNFASLYAETVLDSGLTADQMYDAIDGIYDCIYDNAADILYDGIYSGLLENIYDDFYSGILDDAYDQIPYSEWSNARSNEYKLWNNARSTCYKQWSDMRSEIYELWSDMRSKLYDNDIDKAREILGNFIVETNR